MFAPIIQICAVRRLFWHVSLSVQNGGSGSVAAAWKCLLPCRDAIPREPTVRYRHRHD